jgi:hypothetical protein
MGTAELATVAVFALGLLLFGIALGALLMRRRWSRWEGARSVRALRAVVNATPPSIPVTDEMGRFASLIVEYETAVYAAAIFELQPGPNEADRTQRMIADQTNIRRLRARVLDLLNSSDQVGP